MSGLRGGYAGGAVLAVFCALVIAASGSGQALAGHTPGILTISGGGGNAVLISGVEYGLFLPSNYSGGATVTITVSAASGSDGVAVGAETTLHTWTETTAIAVGSEVPVYICAPGATGPSDTSNCDTFDLFAYQTAASDTRLLSLSMSPGDLGFTWPGVGMPEPTSFAQRVSADTTSVTVSAAPENPIAYTSLLVDGQPASSTVPLNDIGTTTTITVEIRANDSSAVQDYTITVTRGAGDSALSDLSVSPNNISGFAPGTTSYDLAVPSEATTETVTPTLDDANADWAIVNQQTAQTVSTKADPQAITLNATDPTTLQVVVTAEDGIASTTYTINVTHLASETLTAAFTGTGKGTVASTVPTTDINCHKGSATGCSTSYDQGTSVTLGETPDAGSLFEGWSGDCGGADTTTTFTMPASAATCTANFLALGAAQSGTTRTVTTGADDGTATTCYAGLCTLRDALAAVPSGGTVKFAPGVTSVAVNSELDLAKSVTISGTGVTLDGSGGDTDVLALLHISSGTLTASGLELTGAFNTALEIGPSARAILTGVGVDGNGGFDDPEAAGIYDGGTLTMTGGSLDENGAFFCGGIEVAGTATLTNVAITDNGAAIGAGGCVDADATLTLTGSDVENNFADGGGGGFDVDSGTLTATNTVFVVNTAGNWGGAISTESDSGPATLNLTNVTVGGNNVSGGGFAIDLDAGSTTATLVNTSIGLNDSAGIVAGDGSSFTLLNTVIGDNNGPECIGAVTSDGHNVDDDGSCGLSAAGDQPGVNPGFGDPDADGFLTLANGSPALDAGATGTVLGLAVPTTDSEGVKRPQGGGVDIGSNEMPEHRLTIKTVGDGAVDPDAPATTAIGIASPGGWYVAGSTVTLTAFPTGSAAFAKWTGACAGTSPNVAVTISADLTCTATFVDPPTITSFSPTTARPGATVTITGTHLLGTTGVSFGAHPAASFKPLSDTKLTAVVPANVGTIAAAITVSNPAADVPSGQSFTPLWPQPVVSSFSPVKAKAGALVTIVGKNFLGVMDVSFNGHSALISGTPTDTKIVAIVPDDTDDTGHITVTTQGATPTGTSTGTFTFLPPPTIDSFTPDGVFGAPITITGSNFTGTIAVQVGGVAVKFTVKSPTEIDTTVPTTASNTPHPIAVTNAGGTTQSATNFTLDWAQPVVSGFTPASARPGATVTITGSKLTRADDVEFGSQPAASYKVVSDTKITAVVPPSVGTADVAISVNNPGGTAGTSATNFTPLWPQPVVSSFSPVKAKAGALVTIAGKNFLGVMDVSFNGHSASISGTPTDTKIVAIVPDDTDDTGHISVTTQGATPTGTSSGTFTFLPRPTIGSFTPEHAVFGAPITITGSNFTGATSVLIGGVKATFTVKSATEIDAKVPTAASNTPQPISVTNAGGTTVSGDDFTLDWAQPTVAHFTPAHGKVGATVTITGTHFTRASGVSFGGTAAVTFKVVNDTTITAVVPSGAVSGKITVANPGQSGQSATDFTVDPT